MDLMHLQGKTNCVSFDQTIWMDGFPKTSHSPPPKFLKGFYYRWLFSLQKSKVTIKLSSIDPISSKIIIILCTHTPHTDTKLLASRL